MRSAFRLLAPWAKPGARWSHYIVGAAALAAGALHPALPTTQPHQWLANPNVASAPLLSVSRVPSKLAVATAWYVKGFQISYGNGRYQDVSNYLNNLGDREGIAPVFLAATILTESGGNVDAERWAGGLDNSCGLMQQIIANVTALTGITNPRAACDWEENAYNSMAFGARILRDDAAQHGWRVLPPSLYVFYNAGSGWPDAFAFSPTGQAATNYYGNFLPRWYEVLTRYAVPYRPQPLIKPRPTTGFNKRVWNEYRREHHRSVISFRFHGRLSWAASIWQRIPPAKIGGILHHEHWYRPSKHQRYGFTKTSFQGAAIFSWPHYHASKVVHHRWIR